MRTLVERWSKEEGRASKEGSVLHLTGNRAMRKTLRELGVEQGWESGCLNRTAWKEKIG